MFDAVTTAFLESGSALIVGTVGPDGQPHAGRAWGLDVVARSQGEIRLLLDAADVRTAEHLAAPPARIAVTAADVRTLRSMQLKGTATRLEPASDSDRRRARRFCDEFFTDIEVTDGFPRALLETTVPAAFLACAVVIGDRFDQSPGPGAGSRIAESGAP